MKARDLMIGDYVTFKDCQYDSPVIIEIVALGFQDEGEDDCLVNIGHSTACDIIELDDEIVGLPLTPEILEKNGFVMFDKEDDGAVLYEFGSSDLWCEIWVNCSPCLFNSWRKWNGEGKPYNMVCELPINFVHELQRALLLCGIDKEINL